MSDRIERLARPTATRLRSSLVIPSLPQVLSELAHNALDAGAGKVECWVNLLPGEESVRVEDDGHGIDSGGLAVVGDRYSECILPCHDCTFSALRDLPSSP